MTTVLLAGGAGYIGSHCAKALAKKAFCQWCLIISPLDIESLSNGGLLSKEMCVTGPHYVKLSAGSALTLSCISQR
jgi:NAD(P)-dependent dehydrogenase (short-subunit alcohol dehydrogenase family)